MFGFICHEAERHLFSRISPLDRSRAEASSLLRRCLRWLPIVSRRAGYEQLVRGFNREAARQRRFGNHERAARLRLYAAAYREALHGLRGSSDAEA